MVGRIRCQESGRAGVDDNDLEGLMEREFLWNDITVMNSGHL